MEEKLRELQLTQLEILKKVDDVCKKNDIKYSLYAGTLLGAVRHEGFIPWDDDLDICMERGEYERFLKAWEKDAPDGYIMQNKENTPQFTQSFTKIRKENTEFLQYEWEKGRYHTGIFIDIFPIDRMPDGKLKRLFFTFDCMKYQLLTREFVPPKENAAVKAASRLILLSAPKKKRAAKREKLLEKIKSHSEKSYNTVAIETLGTIRTPLPFDMTEAYTYLPFEDGEFMCFEKWDEYLRVKFGDYMQLPPKDERQWKHHPLVLNFEINCEKTVKK